jgi:hypothetical protein
MDRRTYFLVLLLSLGWALMAACVGFVMFLEDAAVVTGDPSE